MKKMINVIITMGFIFIMAFIFKNLIPVIMIKIIETIEGLARN